MISPTPCGNLMKFIHLSITEIGGGVFLKKKKRKEIGGSEI